MPPVAAKVLADAMELTDEERVELADRLYQSAVGVVPRAEIERRIARIKDGTATLLPWDDMRDALRADLKAWRATRGR